MLKKLLLSSLLFTNLVLAENSVGLNINDNDLELLSSININTLTDYANGTTYLLDINYLYSDGDNMSQVAFYGQNSLQGREGLTFAFGIKGVLASDFLAFPLMAKSIYTLPLIDEIPTTSLSLAFAYSPQVLSFRDAKNYLEFRVEADMEIIYNVHIFTGYRNIDTEYNNYDKTFNDSFYAGMKLSF